MKRRHSLPAEVYALVDTTPATVLLEGGSSASDEYPWTRLFTAPVRVCTVHRPEEIPALFAEIESAVRSGFSAAGFFSYECGTYFEAKAPRRKGPDQMLAWFGIYEQSYPFDHDAGRFVEGDPQGLAQVRELLRWSETAAEHTPEISAEFAIPPADYTERIAAIHE
jgi:Anthranilate synthase component I, N terminal region